MNSEPGEQIFFHGHPSWRSMLPFYIRGSVASLIAGVIGGLASVLAGGRVELGWVVAGVLIVFVPALSTGRLRRQRTTYSITSRRLTIETGLFSRELHQTRLERIQNVNARQSLTPPTHSPAKSARALHSKVCDVQVQAMWTPRSEP